MSRTTMSSLNSVRSGGSIELCAATPVLTLIGASPSTSSSEGERSRSNRGSSDDDEPQAWDGFVNEDWRAGGPYLCTLPALTHSIPRGHPLYGRLVVDRVQLYPGIQAILNRANVNTMSIGFCGRQSKFDPEAQPILTAFIAATKRNIEEDWISVSRLVREFLHSQGILRISVELCDARALAPDFFYPLNSNDAIFPIWDRVLKTILRSCDLGGINSVGCYRIGKDQDRTMNPPTIIVTVDTAFPDWRPTREAIINILNYFDLPMVGVKIQRDRIIFGVPSKPELDSTALRDTLQVGHSIGRRGYEGYGTFGGWVELLNSADNRWRAFGITCSHVALPFDVPEITQDRIRGIQINENRNAQLFPLDSPAEADLRGRSVYHSEQASDFENDPNYIRLKKTPKKSRSDTENTDVDYADNAIKFHKAERDAFNSFYNKSWHHAGHVFCASGTSKEVKSVTHSKGEPPMMDWALIQVPTNRAGSNKVLTHGQYPPSSRFPFGAHHTMHNQGPSVNLGHEDYLYKCGRASGYTRGEWSGVDHAHLSRQVIDDKEVPKVTFEHTVTNRPQDPFSVQGDSGSLVFNRHRRVVGMVIGGPETQSFTFITHIEDLFRDIQAKTGAAMVRVQEG